MRLEGKTAILGGGGQSPGEGVGNGRATALTFAREGARVMVLDNRLDSAEETAAMIAEAGGVALAHEADVTVEATLEAAVAATIQAWGRLDILHYNVGVSIAGGDAPPAEITEEAFDRCVAINLRGTVMACKHALPAMREQGSGVILNISSMAAWLTYPLVAYRRRCPSGRQGRVRPVRRPALPGAARGSGCVVEPEQAALHRARNHHLPQHPRRAAARDPGQRHRSVDRPPSPA